MPAPRNPRKRERPTTYFVENSEKKEELVRLTIQDKMLNKGMGTPLAEQIDPGAFRHVLDLACGTGGWIIEAAQTYPAMKLVGIDISQIMLEMASAAAGEQHLTNRVSFQVMDVLRPLKFPNETFDLVNMRLGSSFVRTWEWPALLSEVKRLLQPGGVIRLSESEIIQASSSPALIRCLEMFRCALYRSGHLFTQESICLIDRLPHLVTQHGWKDLQTKIYSLTFQAGTPEWQTYYEDLARFQNLRSFIQKWGCLSADFEAIFQQVLIDAQKSDFYTTWRFPTLWGHKL